MKNRLTALALALCLLLTLGACSQPAPENQEPQTAPESETAPETETAQPEPEQPEQSAAQSPLASFTAEDLDGDEVTEEVFADYEVNMINIWGTFCGPCLDEMPDLGQIAKDYEDEGLQVVGIVGDAIDLMGDGSVLEDVVIEAQNLVEETGADYLHIVPTGELFPNLMTQIYAFPTTIFVDSEGNIIGDIVMGARSKDQWISIIDQLLEQVEA